MSKKKKKRHGHYCWGCNRQRPNEKFSGKGHRRHLCKDCQKRPAADLQAIRQEEEIRNFLRQSRISTANLKRLTELSQSAATVPIARMADLVLAAAKLHPGRKRRLQVLERERPDLLLSLGQYNLISYHGFGDDLDDDGTSQLSPEEAWAMLFANFEPPLEEILDDESPEFRGYSGADPDDNDEIPF